MATGVNISVGSDTRAFAQGVDKGIVEPLEDVQDTFKRVTSAGDASAKQLEDGFREQQAATVEFGRDYDRLTDQIKSASRSTGSEMGSNLQRGAKRGDEAVETATENTKSNLKEVAASFDGSAQSLAGGLQGLAAEVLEGFGPGGLVAGALLAGGIGILSTQLQNADANNELLQQHVADLAGQLIETGHDGDQALGTIVDQLKNLATTTDPAQVSLAKLLKIARDAGASYKDLASAYSGNARGLGDLIEKEERHRDALVAEANATDRSSQQGNLRQGQLNRQAVASQTYIDKLKEAKKTTDAAAEADAAYAKAGGPELQAKADATQAYSDSVQSAYADAGSSIDDFTTKGKVSLDKYNDYVEKQRAAIENYQANVVTASQTLSQDALNYLESLGADAAPLLQAYIDAPNKMKTRTAANWDALGHDSAASYTAGLKGGIPSSVPGPVITPTVQVPDFGPIVTDVQRQLDSKPLLLRAFAVDRNGARVG